MMRQMAKFKHFNTQSSLKRNDTTNKRIRELLRKGTIIGTVHKGPATLQYGKIRDIELVITVSNPGGEVLKVEEF